MQATDTAEKRDSALELMKYVAKAPLFTNRLFCTKQFEIYLRIRHRVIEGKSVVCCDVGRVHVFSKGKGIYSALLETLERHAKVEVLFIENVHNPDHFGIYLRRGFTHLVPDSEFEVTNHFYKQIGKSEHGNDCNPVSNTEHCERTPD